MEENNVSKFEKLEENIESKVYRLEEMYDAMQASLENAKKVKSEQELLIEIIKNDEKHDIFEEFIKSEEEQITQLAKQIDVLSTRADQLRSAIDICKENEEIEKAMTLMLDALGVFAQ